jgi:acetyl esterase/lipase
MKEDIPFHEKRIVYQVPGMQAIQPQQYLMSKHPDGTELVLDQYRPVGVPPEARLPGVLFVHGGPLRAADPLPKDWGAFVSYGQLMAASGLMGLTFNHRYYGKQGEQQAGEDIEAAFAYSLDHAEGLGLDPEQLCVWAFSGAGKLLPVLLRRSESIRSLVLYYTLIAYTGHEALWHKAFARIPICVAQAGLDRANVNKGINRLVSEARSAQATLELLQHPNGHHGFDILDDDARSREIIAQTLAFVRAHT